MGNRVFLAIKNEVKKSLFDYLVILTAGIVFLIFLRTFQGQRVLNFLTLLTFTSFYIIWGIYHHGREKTLSLRSVIEYIFIGFTILLLLTVVFSF